MSSSNEGVSMIQVVRKKIGFPYWRFPPRRSFLPQNCPKMGVSSKKCPVFRNFVGILGRKGAIFGDFWNFKLMNFRGIVINFRTRFRTPIFGR